jgi:hypothetical protein
MQNLLKKATGCRCQKWIFSKLSTRFNLAALDAFGHREHLPTAELELEKNHHRLCILGQHASSICIWWLQIPNMYIFHLGNGHVCKSFDWLQKTLTSSIVQIKPSGGSLLTLYSTLQHRQMMQRKTSKNITQIWRSIDWNYVNEIRFPFFDLVLRTSSRDPSRTEEI